MWAMFWYLTSLLMVRNDFVDVAWGLGFIYIIYWLAHQYHLGGPQALIFIAVCAWGFRLSGYLLLRTIGKPEDRRYAKWRQEWGKTLWWRSFLQIYVLQNLFMLLIALPMVYISTFAQEIEWTWWLVPGIVLWCVGMYWETLADWQKSQHKTDPIKKKTLLSTGLWARSRHPNYFGEICVWWGIWLMVAPYGYAWLTVISPITITYLLLRVSGVPMLEKEQKRSPERERYLREVPAVFPKLKLRYKKSL